MTGLFSLVLLILSATTAAVSASNISNINSNHIFNAIHSSMRQWGSSLNHNGMSFFIATVPAGTHLYHGDSHSKPVEGPEWLAFEPEHALFFARARRGPPLIPPETPSPFQHAFSSGPISPPPRFEGGYLHTFATKHDLRLLMLDGSSAAKSKIGSMDTQSYILAPEQPDDKKEGLGERLRAQRLCDKVEKRWRHQIQGILRMEAGFEVILCSFDNHLDTLRIMSTKGADRGYEDYMMYLQSVTSRYDGIGGNRVQIDYDDFITAFSFPDANVFQFSSLPRLNGTEEGVLQAIHSEVDRIITAPGKQTYELHDWQAIADMLVSRYGSRLSYLTSRAVRSKATLSSELHRIMRPFINYSASDLKEEMRLCTEEFIPASWPSNQASRAIRSVSNRICSTLFSLLSNKEDLSFPASIVVIKDLMSWLGWSGWKRCSGCDIDEICLIPMWPHGSKQDWIRPSCVKARDLREHTGYWEEL